MLARQANNSLVAPVSGQWEWMLLAYSIIFLQPSYSMWKQFVKDYLRFTKGERRAVLVLLSLTLLVVVLPWCWPVPKAVPPDKQLLQQLERQMAQLKQPGRTKETSYAAHAAFPPAGVSTHRVSGRLFYFDPNTLPAAGWQELGLRDKTIQTIVHYRERGGHFRRPEDLDKVYGLWSDEYARLLPYVKIEAAPPAAGKQYPGPVTGLPSPPTHYYTSYSRKTTVPHGIEINAADTLALTTLPGIGDRLAARIVRFREKLGGFYSVEQVGETYALPDSVFQQIKPLLRCDSNAVHRVNINAADANALRQHPYIRWNIANAIVEYRRQHGDYKSLDDLQKIAIMTPELLERLKPYLAITADK